MNEELMITKEDLVNWLNRPPSNDDLDLIGFITTRLENFYKLEQENKQLKSILTELEEWLKEQGNNGIDEWGNHYTVCLYKLNKLKERYK